MLFRQTTLLQINMLSIQLVLKPVSCILLPHFNSLVTTGIASSYQTACH